MYFSPTLNVTFLAHMLQRISEKVRELFLNVNTLVNNFKKVFLKALRYVEVYKDVLPNVALLPEPYSPGEVLVLKQLPFVMIILNS
jgi:hypothetical protein